MNKLKVDLKSQEFLIIINKLKKFDEDTPGNILYVNETAYKRLGYTYYEIFSLNAFDLSIPINTIDFKNKIQKLYMGKLVNYPMFFLTKEGKIVLVDIKAEIINYKNEKAVLTVAEEINNHNHIKSIIMESNNELENKIVEIEKIKEQLFQKEKLVTFGKMATGIAHEINNPLGYICSNVETAEVYFNKLIILLNENEQILTNTINLSVDKLNERIKQIYQLRKEMNLEFILNDLKYLFKDVKEGLRNISEIVSSLKTFSRIDSAFEFKEYNLNDGIENSLIIARNEIKYCAQVSEKYGNIPNVVASGNRINEVILNLLLNSCYAIKEKKTKEQGLIKVTTYLKDDYVICEIEDNGIGIKQTNINKVFNDYYTTKPIGDGTGLGLSIAHDTIVNKHQGKINIESKFGIGTKITFSLPVKHIERY